MRKPRRRLPFPWRLFFGSVLVFTLLATLNFVLLERFQGGNEARFLWHILRSYSASETELYLPMRSWPLQVGLEPLTGSAPRRFDLPLPFLLLLFPLMLFPSDGWAAAFALLLLEVTLPLTVVLAVRLAEWPLSWKWQVLLIFLAVLWPYSFLGLREVAPFWLFLALLHAGLLALRAQQDELAGALLALLTLRWEATAGALLFLTFYAIRRRRWRVLAGAGMLLFLLYNIAFLLRPAWFLPFLRAVTFNLRQGFGVRLADWLQQIFPAWPVSPALIVSLGIVILLFVEWRLASLGERPLAFYWTLNLSLVLTPWLGLRFQLPDLTMLFPSLILIAALSWKRWPRYGLFLPFLLLLLAFFVPWALWQQALRHPQEVRWQQALYLFPSLFALSGLYWFRWSLFRPRTWLDRIRAGDVI